MLQQHNDQIHGPPKRETNKRLDTSIKKNEIAPELMIFLNKNSSSELLLITSRIGKIAFMLHNLCSISYAGSTELRTRTSTVFAVGLVRLLNSNIKKYNTVQVIFGQRVSKSPIFD